MSDNDKKLKMLENKHEGKIFVVVGTGPSLHFENIDLLRSDKIIIIVLNSAMLKIPFAHYFVGDDWALSRWSYWEDLKKDKFFSMIKLFYRSKLEKYSKGMKNCIFFDHRSFYDPYLKKKDYSGLYLYKDPLRGICGARTASGTACNFAYCMGGGGENNPILLLGHDCSFSGKGGKKGYRYYWQYDGEKKPYKLDNKPLEWIAKGKKDGYIYDNHSQDFISYWKDFVSIVLKKQKINIINCSCDGWLKYLEIFPNMTLEEALEKYG